MLKNILRKIYNLIPDNNIKKYLGCLGFSILYRKYIKFYRFNGEYFDLKLFNNVEIKSYKSFDPAPIVEIIGDFQKKNESYVCFDLGGNIGAVSIFLSKYLGSTSKIFSFECDEKNIDIFKKNLSLNNINNVVLIEKGVWNTSTELEFYCGGNYTSSILKTNYIESCEKKYEKRIIKTTTIDEVVKEYNINKIDFMKIDIEGSELMALEGGSDSIKRFKPYLIVETHIVDGKSNRDSIIDFLNKVGYKKIHQKGNDRMPTIFACEG